MESESSKSLPVLVVNCGSSSVKFALVEVATARTVLTGLAERIGNEDARLKLKTGDDTEEVSIPNADHRAAVGAFMASLERMGSRVERPVAVGHRVVHGGERFSGAVRLDPGVIAEIEACSGLAPLHNPANLTGIAATGEAFPDLMQVAVFDTAFHQTMPESAFLYAVPYSWYREHGVRRYGFHGTSHQYVSGEAARYLGMDPAACGLIVLHLGNGCSSCAVWNGRSVDTSMGLSPLEGMAMGTRSGDVDPDLPRFIGERCGLGPEEISGILNRQSGLLGLSGNSSDMRTLQALADAGDRRARLAIDVFVHRAAKSVGSMAASLPHLDAVVFTGGIGENAASVRGAILERLAVLGIGLDPAANGAVVGGIPGRLSPGKATPAAVVIPTNEEWMIAKQTAGLLPGNPETENREG